MRRVLLSCQFAMLGWAILVLLVAFPSTSEAQAEETREYTFLQYPNHIPDEYRLPDAAIVDLDELRPHTEHMKPQPELTFLTTRWSDLTEAQRKALIRWKHRYFVPVTCDIRVVDLAKASRKSQKTVRVTPVFNGQAEIEHDSVTLANQSVFYLRDTAVGQGHVLWCRKKLWLPKHCPGTIEVTVFEEQVPLLRDTIRYDVHEARDANLYIDEVIRPRQVSAEEYPTKIWLIGLSTHSSNTDGFSQTMKAWESALRRNRNQLGAGGAQGGIDVKLRSGRLDLGDKIAEAFEIISRSDPFKIGRQLVVCVITPELVPEDSAERIQLVNRVREEIQEYNKQSFKNTVDKYRSEALAVDLFLMPYLDGADTLDNPRTLREFCAAVSTVAGCPHALFGQGLGRADSFGLMAWRQIDSFLAWMALRCDFEWEYDFPWKADIERSIAMVVRMTLFDPAVPGDKWQISTRTDADHQRVRPVTLVREIESGKSWAVEDTAFVRTEATSVQILLEYNECDSSRGDTLFVLETVPSGIKGQSGRPPTTHFALLSAWDVDKEIDTLDQSILVSDYLSGACPKVWEQLGTPRPQTRDLSKPDSSRAASIDAPSREDSVLLRWSMAPNAWAMTRRGANDGTPRDGATVYVQVGKTRVSRSQSRPAVASLVVVGIGWSLLLGSMFVGVRYFKTPALLRKWLAGYSLLKRAIGVWALLIILAYISWWTIGSASQTSSFWQPLGTTMNVLLGLLIIGHLGGFAKDSTKDSDDSSAGRLLKTLMKVSEIAFFCGIPWAVSYIQMFLLPAANLGKWHFVILLASSLVLMIAYYLKFDRNETKESLMIRLRLHATAVVFCMSVLLAGYVWCDSSLFWDPEMAIVPGIWFALFFFLLSIYLFSSFFEEDADVVV